MPLRQRERIGTPIADCPPKYESDHAGASVFEARQPRVWSYLRAIQKRSEVFQMSGLTYEEEVRKDLHGIL
jgi:hypothetical protein